MMNSDDEREIDIESDEENGGSSGGKGVPADKRAHHNALERKRRDHIKESFSGLRDAIPNLKGDKSSRAQILKKASEYISVMRSKQNHQTRDIDNLKRQNSHLEAQIKALERAKNSGQYHSSTEILESQGLNYDPSDTELPIGSEASSGSMGRASMGDGGSGSDTDSGHGHPASGPTARSTTTVLTTGSGSGGNSVIYVASPPSSGTTGMASGRQIQPGQSLLIMSGGAAGGGEPAKKKFKS